MEVDELSCICGRYFQRPAALSNHQRSCTKRKTQLSVLLLRAKDLWDERHSKKQKLASAEPETNPGPTALSIKDNSAEVQPEADNKGNLSSDLSTSIAAGRARRKTRLPRKFDDLVPHSDTEDDTTESSDSDLPSSPSQSNVVIDQASEPEAPRTQLNSPTISDHPIILPRDKFGVFRQYYCASHVQSDPDFELTLEDLSDLEALLLDPPLSSLSENLEQESSPAATMERIRGKMGPYPNRSSFLLAEWYWGGSKQKSRRDFHELVRILTDHEFDPNEIRKTPWTKIDKLLGTSEKEKLGVDLDAGWMREEIELSVPFHRYQSDSGAQPYSVGTFFRRSIVSIIQDALAGPDGRHFHFEPFDVFWQNPGGDPSKPPLRIYGELYNSHAFADEHRRLQQWPKEPGCSLPRSIIALMFSSDETQLTQYGENKLWPLYMYFGNVSKYLRTKPNAHQCHHVAYFISLPDGFSDFVRSHTGKGPNDHLETFCGRELLHTQWKHILDDDFLDSYAHGFVFKCHDGKTRRLYPRVFTLSADYKEKVSLTGVRQSGLHPCPRCLVEMKEAHLMGTEEARSQAPRLDNQEYRKTIATARQQIFKKRYAVKGAVDVHLDRMSLTANEIAFSVRLSQYGFDVFQASVVDIMHDTEQGSWKAVFIHLIRLLECEDETQKVELDARYREVPPFGRDTIRRFRRNMSAMKGMAARDYEDLLQCSIPVFEDLLPDTHNARIMKLLFIYAHWHGLAKLRLHTDATLKLFDEATTDLGQIMREFQTETCKVYDTKELEEEKQAREKRRMNAEKKKAENAKKQLDSVPCAQTHSKSVQGKGSSSSGSDSVEGVRRVDPDSDKRDIQPTVDDSDLAKPKEFNLNTYKFHAHGHYAENIRLYGTTDSYSTELGESEHRRSKARYAKTNKKDFMKQLAQIERREDRIRRLREENLSYFAIEDLPSLRKDLLRGKAMKDRYHISQTQSKTENILDFMRAHPGDPAMKNFLRELKIHLLPRVYQESMLDKQPRIPQASIFFQYDRIYEHKVLRLNYTTYDLRRAQDFVNPKTSQSNVMVLTDLANAPPPDDLDTNEITEPHPFGYAKILKIFHVDVICADPHTPPTPLRRDVLWVRWYQRHPSRSPHQLDELSFVPMTQEEAFGFIDPCDVIRSCHIIPAFAKGRKYETGDKGLSSFAADKDDWNAYYVNRFVDRDMLMRYQFGFGIGHTMIRSAPDGSPIHGRSQEETTAWKQNKRRAVPFTSTLGGTAKATPMQTMATNSADNTSFSPELLHEVARMYHDVESVPDDFDFSG